MTDEFAEFMEALEPAERQTLTRVFNQVNAKRAAMVDALAGGCATARKIVESMDEEQLLLAYKTVGERVGVHNGASDSGNLLPDPEDDGEHGSPRLREMLGHRGAAAPAVAVANAGPREEKDNTLPSAEREADAYAGASPALLRRFGIAG